jgi:hypothetical protein
MQMTHGTLHVCGLAGHVCDVEVDHTTTLADLKKKIEDLSNISSRQQLLLNGSDLLYDDCSSVLQHLNIQSEEPVQLSLLKRTDIQMDWLDKISKGWLLSDAPDEVVSDPEIAMIAVKQNPYSYRFLANSLKLDVKLALVAVRKNRKYIDYVPDALRRQHIFAYQAAKEKLLSQQPPLLVHADFYKEILLDPDVFVCLSSQQLWMLETDVPEVQRMCGFIRFLWGVQFLCWLAAFCPTMLVPFGIIYTLFVRPTPTFDLTACCWFVIIQGGLVLIGFDSFQMLIRNIFCSQLMKASRLFCTVAKHLVNWLSLPTPCVKSSQEILLSKICVVLGICFTIFLESFCVQWLWSMLYKSYFGQTGLGVNL